MAEEEAAETMAECGEEGRVELCSSTSWTNRLTSSLRSSLNPLEMGTNFILDKSLAKLRVLKF